MRPRRHFLWLGAALVASMGALAAAGGAARAAGPGRGPALELSVILATRTDGGTSVDPQIHDLPALTKEPFVRYNVYRLLSRDRFALEAGKPVVSSLANGRTLRVAVDEGADDAGEKRYRMDAQIAEPGKRAYLRSLQVTASENEPFFVGGQSYQGGTLFLELVVRP